MPMYEYRCDKCETVHEVIQKFSDAPLTACECGGRLEKLMSRTSFALKGSGWYTTDYKRKASPPAAAGEGSKASDSAAGGAGSASSASAATSSAPPVAASVGSKPASV